jgi:3',5'-cyclic AMP phosphodiesterase CpdA
MTQGDHCVRLAHLSDLHVLNLDGVAWYRYANKRVTGLINLGTLRKHAHPEAVFEALVADVLAQNVDHTAVTGDVSNLALESEFARARTTLSRLGDTSKLSLIPGNHDIYTWGARKRKRFEAFFGDWLGAPLQAPARFPFSKQLDGLLLIGFNTAYPTLPMLSHGSLSKGTLTCARRAIEESGRTNQKRLAVALVHHNLHSRGLVKNWTSSMRARRRTLHGLFEAGFDLVLHGHTHRAHAMEYAEHGRTMQVLGCGSSTWAHPKYPARYNVIEVVDGALLKVRRRVYRPESQRFEEELD